MSAFSGNQYTPRILEPFYTNSYGLPGIFPSKSRDGRDRGRLKGKMDVIFTIVCFFIFNVVMYYVWFHCMFTVLSIIYHF